MTTAAGSGQPRPARPVDRRYALRGLPAVSTEPPFDDELPRAEPPGGPARQPDLARPAGQLARRALSSGGRCGPATIGSSSGRVVRPNASPNRGPGDVRLPLPSTASPPGQLPADPPPGQRRPTSSPNQHRTTDGAVRSLASTRTLAAAAGAGRGATRIPRQAPDSRLRESPHPAAMIVVRAIVEVLTGTRPVTHLAGWATPPLLASLEPFGGRYPGRGTVRSIRVSEPRTGIAEVVAVIARGDRAAALALRMEATNGRWQVTTLQIG